MLLGGSMKKVSIVVPCFNEEENVFLFYKTCLKVFKNYKYKLELIFVNDGSKDKTFSEIEKVVKESKEFSVIGINFSRNFGKDAAMYAGLEKSSGDYVAIIDADLQQPPELIKDMIDVLENDETYDEVCYYQKERIENKIISFLKKKFYSFISKVSEVDFYNGASDFRLFRRYVVDSILSLGEKNRFSKGIFSWVGFNVKYLPYVPLERVNGKSNFNFIKLLKYAMSGIVSFSSFPLKFILNTGLVITFSSILFLIVYLVCFIMKIVLFKYGVIIGIIVLSLGLILTALGIIGEYIYSIHIETKYRPIYISKKIVRSEDKI